MCGVIRQLSIQAPKTDVLLHVVLSVDIILVKSTTTMAKDVYEKPHEIDMYDNIYVDC